MKAYEAKDFATAQVGFMDLAELGDGASQFNLGAMALRGEGMDKDMAKAAGWLRAAQQNGYAPDPDLVTRLNKVLTPEQRNAADSIVGRYGREALAATILAEPNPSCLGLEQARALAAVQPDFPREALDLGLQGVVLLVMTVGSDGLGSDMQVIVSVPEEHFETEAINAALRSRFSPPLYHGKPARIRHQLKYTFAISGGGGLWDMPAIQTLKAAAEAGHPAAQYIIGAVAYLERSLGIDRVAARKMILSAAQGGDPRAQYWMAEETSPNECAPVDRSRVWLEHSAEGGNPAARVALARRLIEAGDPERSAASTLLASLGDTRDAYVLKHAVALAAGVAGIDFHDAALATKLAKQLAATPRSLDPQREEALAAASAIEGNFAKAEKLQARALDKATALNWNVTRIEERVQSYRAGQLWKGDLFVLPPAANVPPPKGKLGTVTRD